MTTLLVVFAGLGITSSSAAEEGIRFFRVFIQVDRGNGMGTAATWVTPLGGQLLLAGKDIRTVSQAAVPRGVCTHPTVRCSGIHFSLPIRPIGKAVRELDEVGRATVRFKLTYTLDDGSRREVSKALTLSQRAVVQPVGLKP